MIVGAVFYPDRYDPVALINRGYCQVISGEGGEHAVGQGRHAETALNQIGIVDDILQEETKRALLAAVNALGEPDREILIRRYYYDQKPREIARSQSAGMAAGPGVRDYACLFRKDMFYVL